VRQDAEGQRRLRAMADERASVHGESPGVEDETERADEIYWSALAGGNGGIVMRVRVLGYGRGTRAAAAPSWKHAIVVNPAPSAK
jgi:hypothetical protein